MRVKSNKNKKKLEKMIKTREKVSYLQGNLLKNNKVRVKDKDLMCLKRGLVKINLFRSVL